MRKDAIRLEERRFKDVDLHDLQDYPSFHERHRIFPMAFENRCHNRILDVAAGMGVVGKRIHDKYQADVLCNDVCPTCLEKMQEFGLTTISFDIDDEEKFFPFPESYFDAIIALATIEHVIHIDQFLKEVNRVLRSDGFLYISAPNYSGLVYLLPFLLTGKTFHDPFVEPSRYEFYAHVRYFTYKTLLELVGTFGFTPDTVYLAIPQNSSKFQRLYSESKAKALMFQFIMKQIYTFFSPRWAAEPVLCFRKCSIPDSKTKNMRIRKVIL
jgi:ubiquinone/menaquinone biosynthesis C-methylase UbiE